MAQKQTLSAACSDIRKAIAGAQAWTRGEANARRIGTSRSLIERELRRAAVKAHELEKAVERPMCVGVFGPSQTGKSYLISALARRGTEPLMAAFDGLPEDLDFVRQINPEGGEESTGLVTRFSIRSVPTPQGYPVAVRLLSQPDLVKILGNTYFSDCELDDEKLPSQSDLEALIAQAKALTSSAPAPVTEEDTWDIRDYFEQGQFKGVPAIRALSGIGYFDVLSELVPGLSTEGRSLVFSMLWGQVQPLTDLYTRLARRLEDLGNAGDAFCTVDSLVTQSGGRFERRADSIVNVNTLDTLGADGQETLSICTANGRSTKISRADLTALVAELLVTIRTSPWDFFAHTDLLDFPGARSRERIPDVKAFLKKERSLKDLFRRGKVAYLFERYSAEQELTSMLLCIGPGNQEVRTLPAIVKGWIDTTHGETPVIRAANDTALCLVLTKFDLEFEEAAGKSDDTSERWSRRLSNSLTKFFGQAHNWPHEWKPGRPFNNTFWLRNPNFINKSILDYDDSGKEMGIRATESARIGRAREAFVENADVRKHFHDPGKAWDEAFRLNDGGVTYLARSLKPICNPEIKLRQISTRLGALRDKIEILLRPYHVPLDLGDRRIKRVIAYEAAADSIIEVNERGQLGTFIRSLGIEPATLKETIYRARVDAPNQERKTSTNDSADGSKSIEPSAARNGGSSKTRAEIVNRIKGRSAPIERLDGVEAEQPRQFKDREAKHERVASAALECWTARLDLLKQDRAFVASTGIDIGALADVAQELMLTATRVGLEQKIAARIKEVTFATDHKELFAAKATVLAGAMINHFVSSFGSSESINEPRRVLRFDGTAEAIFAQGPDNPTPDTLPAEPRDFLGQYLLDWVRAMEDAMRANVEGDVIGTPEEREQNEILGAVLSQLQSVPASSPSLR